MRVGMWGLAVLFGLAASEAFGASVGISKLETKDLELLYFDPLQTYLTPYIARAYENSFAFQERVFGWTPWDRPVIFLTDQADSGNASARSVPDNAVVVKIAPFPTTFETFTAGERFFTLMNHELVHVATMDVWNDDDAFWRSFLHGKPNPISDHPGIDRLQLSRRASRQRSTLVPRGQRCLFRDMDERRPGARPGRL